MQVPFLDLKANYLSVKDEVLKEIHEVLETTGYILGPKVVKFENDFAKMHNVKHCVGLSTGTDASHVIMWALNLKAGDEVIVPANTFIASAWGIALCGATPVFVDCEKDSYNIDPIKVEEAISSKTKAIVAVHLYGQSANLDPLKQIAAKYNVALIEDAAQAHLAEYKNQKIGGLGDMALFSFYPGKNLGTYGEGGAVTTNNDQYATTIKMIRDQGQSQKYHHDIIGHNYRMEAIQGAVLGVKLKYLNDWTNKRRAIANRYREALRDIEEITLPKEMDYAKHVYHLFVLQVTERAEMQEFLTKNEIASGLHYPIPLHMQKCFNYLGYKKGDFPVTEQLASNCLSLPMFPEMTDEQIEYVTTKVRAFYKASVLA